MSEKIATRDAYGKALVDLGGVDPRIVVLDADLAKSTKTVDFASRFPDRFFDMGIAEANLMATAAGLAAAGKVPFASTFAIFASCRALDQVRNSICYPALSVKIAATHAGLTVGEDGASHQAIEDLAIMRAIPNLRVVVPADAVETREVIRVAALTPGPFYIRLGRPAVPVLLGPDYRFELGRATVLHDGRDVALFASGVMVAEALAAARSLETEGIGAAVLNVSCLKPIDAEAIVSFARRCGAAVTAEEHSVIGGLGGAVAEVLSDRQPTPLVRVGVRDTFGESGTPAELLKKYGLTAGDVEAAAREAIRRKGLS